MQCMGVGKDGGAWGKSWNGNQWGDWESYGGTWSPSAPLCMVGWGGQDLDYYGVGTDKSCYHQQYDGSKWDGYEGIGGTFSTGISVSVSSSVIDIFGVGTGTSNSFLPSHPIRGSFVVIADHGRAVGVTSGRSVAISLFPSSQPRYMLIRPQMVLAGTNRRRAPHGEVGTIVEELSSAK